MLSSVQFNDYLSPLAAKIHNVFSNDDLPFHPYRISSEKSNQRCRSSFVMFLLIL